jgi:hypothetical protein
VTTASISSSLTLPVASSATAVTESISTTPPGSTPALAGARAAQHARAIDALSSPIVYLEITDTESVTFSGSPGIVFTLPTTTTGISYELASYSNGSWNNTAAGPVTGSGTTVTFPETSTGSTTISPSVPEIVALYAIDASASPSPGASSSPSAGASASPSAAASASPSAAASASPSPRASASPSPGASASPSAAASASPSASPSPSPLPLSSPVASPTELDFDVTAPGQQSFTVLETNDTNGTYTAAIVCSAASPPPSSPPADDYVATLANTTASQDGSAAATFTVNGGQLPGSCTVTITDAHDQTTTVTVNVSQTNLSVNSHKRRTH